MCVHQQQDTTTARGVTATGTSSSRVTTSSPSTRRCSDTRFGENELCKRKYAEPVYQKYVRMKRAVLESAATSDWHSYLACACVWTWLPACPRRIRRARARLLRFSPLNLTNQFPVRSEIAQRACTASGARFMLRAVCPVLLASRPNRQHMKSYTRFTLRQSAQQ